MSYQLFSEEKVSGEFLEIQKKDLSCFIYTQVSGFWKKLMIWGEYNITLQEWPIKLWFLADKANKRW